MVHLNDYNQLDSQAYRYEIVWDYLWIGKQYSLSPVQHEKYYASKWTNIDQYVFVITHFNLHSHIRLMFATNISIFTTTNFIQN